MLTITKGSDVKIGVILTRKNALTGISKPEDLTGKTVTAYYKNGADVLVTKTVPGNGISIDDAVYGGLSVVLSDTDTAALAEGGFDFDVHVEDGPDKSIWRFVGKVVVEERIV
jgi:hypothetical protein